MSDADDKLNFCKQALGEIGTRSTITSLDPLDGSPEAFYCALFFESTRDQVLRAAHWGFAGRSDVGRLWKALPGTPENPMIPEGYVWSPRDPHPPWLYSYTYPGTRCIQLKRVREPPLSDLSASVPLFSEVNTGTNWNQSPCVPFEVGVDHYDRAGMDLQFTQRVNTITIVAAGTDYRPSDYITMVGDAASLMGQPVTLHISTVDVNGGVTSVLVSSHGTFAGATISLSQSDTTGAGTGFTCTATFTDSDVSQKVILTNARNAILEYTTSYIQLAEYDPGFADAFMLAFEGKLALALTGDKQLATGKLQQANAALIEARVRDGNEGLTTYDHVPDWLQVRGVSSMTPTVPFNPPYGPLFGV